MVFKINGVEIGSIIKQLLIKGDISVVKKVETKTTEVKIEDKSSDLHLHFHFYGQPIDDQMEGRIRNLLKVVAQGMSTNPINPEFLGVGAVATTAGMINMAIIQNSDYLLKGVPQPQYVGTGPLILTDGVLGVITSTDSV